MGRIQRTRSNASSLCFCEANSSSTRLPTDKKQSRSSLRSPLCEWRWRWQNTSGHWSCRGWYGKIPQKKKHQKLAYNILALQNAGLVANCVLLCLVKFDTDQLPPILNALETDNAGQKLVLEVAVCELWSFNQYWTFANQQIATFG